MFLGLNHCLFLGCDKCSSGGFSLGFNIYIRGLRFQKKEI